MGFDGRSAGKLWATIIAPTQGEGENSGSGHNVECRTMPYAVWEAILEAAARTCASIALALNRHSPLLLQAT
jgi:hypothetical protein